MGVYLVTIFLALALSSSTAKLDSPCPTIFQYESVDEPGKWEGVATLVSDDDLHGLWIRVILSAPAKEFEVADNFGEVKKDDERKEFLIKNRRHILKAGVPAQLRITVKYDGTEVPEVVAIRLNARVVCPKNSGEQFTFVKPNEPETSNEYFLGDLNSKDFLLNRKTGLSAVGCGTAPLHAGSLSNVQKTSEGQWPWHASIYLSRGNTQTYVCAGTLISANHILTAAHCVSQKNSETPLDAASLTVSLGKYFTQSDSTGVQEISVSEVILHPSYNDINLGNDIAIIKLSIPAKFTDYVRPACLWEEDANLSSVLRREGAVVGFGFDSNERYTENLAQAKMRVVSPDVCINSNQDIASFLNLKTFCAGYVRGNSVCAGDSGSGLVFLREGLNPIWQLRAFVSFGVALQNKFVCDQTSFAVFTDVVNYSKWIRASIA